MRADSDQPDRPDHSSDWWESPRAEVSTPEASQRWRATEEIFHRALNIPDVSADERARLVAEWCGDDVFLLESVLALLEADSCVEELISTAPPVNAGDFLERSPLVGGTDSGDGEDNSSFDGEGKSEEDQWPGRVLGAFRVERLLGRGGMGVVYLGERVSGGFSQTVAIKLVGRHLRSSPAVEQFLVERETLARLEHANIAGLIDGGVTSEGFPYVVMEYIEGRRLDVACDDPATSLIQIIRWMLQLCEAVTYVHRNLILHRDLKPSNVMVTGEGTVKLLDFGTLKRIGPDSATDSAMTTAGMRPITVRYASPEHIEGTGMSTAADVYSLGMILYRVIAGRLPEGLDNLPIGQYLEHLKEGRFKPPSQLARRKIEAHIARDLDAIVAKAIRYEPEARYPTAIALIEDLWNLLLHRPVTASEGNLRYRAVKFYRRHKWPIRAAAAAFAVLVAGVSGMAWQGHLAHLEELRAEAGVEDERQLAHMLLFDYFEKLSLIPGSVEPQRKAVSQAIVFLDRLAHIAPGSTLELDVIEGYKDMGSLLGNPYEQNLGNEPAAIQSLNKALSLAQARMRRYPHDLNSLSALAAVELPMGSIYLGNGDAVRGEQYLRLAADTTALIADDPHVTGQMLRQASNAWDLLGDVYDPGRGYAAADLGKAMRTYLRSDAYDEKCRVIDPKDDICRSSVVVGEYKIGMLLEGTDPGLAASHFQHGLDVVNQFSPEQKKTTRSHRLLNYMLSRLSLMQIRAGHMGEGMKLARQARTGFREAIAKAELDNRARFDLVAFETDLATEYEHFGRNADAAETAHDVLKVLSILLQRSTGNKRWQMIQAEDLMTSGRVETKLGNRSVGVEASRNGLAEAVRLAEEKDASPEVLELAADGLLELHPQTAAVERARQFAQKAADSYARPMPAQLLTLAKAQHAAGQREQAANNARLVLAALTGPVKSWIVAEEIADARRIAK